MPIPLLPIVVCCLGAAAYHQSSKRSKGPGKGILTPEREHYYNVAIREVKEPEKLRLLAKTFREEGFPVHAEMLEKRANLRAIPADKKKERRAIFKRAMNSTDATAIRNLANAFEREGCTGAAKELRDYAASLPVATPVAEVKPVEPSSPKPVQTEVTAATEESLNDDLNVPDSESLTEEETAEEIAEEEE